MAVIYVRSTDGSDADSGATWALAKATIAGASAIDAAGDTIYVSQAHAESTASSSNAWAGTNASPVAIIGASDAAEPPTAGSTAPTVTVSGTTFTWGGAAYTYGLNFVFSSGSSWAPVFNGTSAFNQKFENCSFYVTGAGGSTNVVFGNATAGGNGSTELIGCSFKLGNTGQVIDFAQDVVIRGGSWAAGGTSPTGAFALGANTVRGANLLVEGFDFSALSAGVNLIQTLTNGGTHATFRNCKLPASWSGALVASGTLKPGCRVGMFNCDSGSTNYKLYIQDYQGTIRDETTIVRSGGATDGTTALSWKMASNANNSYLAAPLASGEIVGWNDTTGASKTVTVEIVTDNVTLTDAECWIDVQYLGTSGNPLSLFANDSKANFFATAANQDTSTATWTTTGLTTPVKQKLVATLTPQKKGFFIATVKLAKASTTIYVDPKLTVA